MASFFDSQTLDISCEDCGRNHSKTIGWIKTHDRIDCPCGTTINLDRDQFVRNLRDVEKAFDRIPKEIKIKF